MARARTRRRERRSVPRGRAYIRSTFNNTLVTLTDLQGAVLASSSAGSSGFKGSRKGTAFAAQRAAEQAARKGMDQGLRHVEVCINGPGAGEGGGHTLASILRPYHNQHQGRNPHTPQRVPASQP